ncbi:MAG TPA: hypothetical protein VD994_03980, partial [Prosthecobacter sp.]|nr:hypothetical protein [Prosthecobacter sp.]
QTAAELRTDLKRLKRDTDSGRSAAVSQAVPLATQAVPAAAPVTSSSQILYTEAKRHKLGLISVVVGLVAIGAIGAVLLYKWLTPNAPVPFASITSQRITNSGKAQFAAISPDGRYIAHVMRDGDNSSLWVRQVSTGANVQVVKPAPAPFVGITFSPDGEHLYFVRSDPSNFSYRYLYKVPVLGGTERQLLFDIDTPVTFSPDGKRIAFIRNLPQSGESVLFIANSEGGDVQRLTTRKMPYEYRLTPISWSPNGKLIAASTWHKDERGDLGAIAFIDPDSRKEVKVQAMKQSVGALAWLPDGSGVLGVSDDQMERRWQVWFFPQPAGEPRRVTSDINDYSDQALSLTADGARFVTVLKEQPWTLSVADAATLDRPRSLTGTMDESTQIAWTHDGRILITTGKGRNLVAVRAPDGQMETLLSEERFIEFPEACGSGAYVYSSVRDNLPVILHVAGGVTRTLFNGFAVNLHCTADGKWLHFSNLEDNLSAVRMKTDGSGGVDTISPNAAYHRVSPDGKTLAYLHFERRPGQPALRSLRCLDVESRKETCNIGNISPAIDGGDWAPGGKAVDMIDTRAGVSNLWRFDLATGKRRQLTNFTSDEIFSMAWSPDGKRLALARGTVRHDVVMVTAAK